MTVPKPNLAKIYGKTCCLFFHILMDADTVEHNVVSRAPDKKE